MLVEVSWSIAMLLLQDCMGYGFQPVGRGLLGGNPKKMVGV